MKNTILFLLFSITASTINAQINDTIWLNKKWNETVKDSASYYRITRFDNISQRYIVKDYFLDGRLQMSGRYISLSPKIMDGVFTWYYPDKKIEHRYFEDNLYKIIEWDKKGNIIRDEGKNALINTVRYINGEPIYEQKAIDQAPEFPGGENGLIMYVSNKMIYPEKAIRKKIEGQVIIRFVIDMEGKVSNASVFKSTNSLFDDEALRLVKGMPKWSPSILDDKPINVFVQLPINFKLN